MLDYLPRRRRVGGLRVDPRKRASTQEAIAAGFVPARLFIPLHKHFDTTPEICVAGGEPVLKGQAIALGRPGSGVADVHASSSGKVVDFAELRWHTARGAETLQCVVVETDGRDTVFDAAGGCEPSQASGPEILELLRRCGIAGLGGAAVSTSWKLGRGPSCSTVIINGAECEPYISCDDMLMREHARGILEGSLLLCDLLDAQRCIVAIERDKPEALAAIRAGADGLSDDRLYLAELPRIYPAGGERQLVELLIGKEVPSGRYPTDIGIVCQNVGTALAVQRAVKFAQPLIDRVVTLTGNGLAQPRNVRARIGTTIADLVAHHGGYRGDPAALIIGGSMMGFAQASDAIPVTKATNCVLVPDAEEFGEKRAEWPCIRCGECAAACPARLLPQELLRAARAGNFTELDSLGLDDCIECGCCDAICPSQIALTRRFITAKQTLQNRRESERFAEVAQSRFDSRTHRMAAQDDRDQQEQEALRARLATDEDRKRTIAAALRRARERAADTDTDTREDT